VKIEVYYSGYREMEGRNCKGKFYGESGLEEVEFVRKGRG